MIPRGSNCECLQGQEHIRYMKLCIKKYHIYQVLTVELPLFRGEVLTAHLEPRHPA